MTTTYDAFISYAPQDTDWVRWLADQMREQGLQVAYRDALEEPGLLIVSTIEKAIEEAAHGVLVFSRASLSDPWVREAYETLIRRSIEGRRRFIPVLIEDVDLPEFAANRFHVDLSHADGPDVVRRLDTLIHAIRERPRPPHPGPGQRPGSRLRPDNPRRFTLRITSEKVTLLAADGEIRHQRPAMSKRLESLRWRLETARRRGPLLTRGSAPSRG